MLVDAHMHLWDRIAGRLGNEKVKPLRNGIVLIGKRQIQGMPSWFLDCRNTAEMAISAFDDAGVDTGIVTQEYLDGNQNEYLLKVMRKYPGRFFVHGLIDFRAPSNLKAGFRKAVAQGFKGIKCPAMPLPELKPRVYLDDPKIMEIWEEMESRGMVLSVDLAPGSTQVPEMRRVIKRFPKLKIAIGHFGLVTMGDWLSQIRLAEFPGVYIECGGLVWLFRKEGPPFKTAQEKIRQAARAVGADKLMWGSDYPRTMTDFTYRQSLEFATSGCEFFTEKEKAGFLGENAAGLYNLPHPSKKRKPRIRITEI